VFFAALMFFVIQRFFICFPDCSKYRSTALKRCATGQGPTLSMGSMAQGFSPAGQWASLKWLQAARAPVSTVRSR
jgi:hypothetical protein